MALSDAIQGARHVGQTITWTQKNGSIQILTGATITARIISTSLSAVAFNSDGTFNVTNGANGIFTWAYGAIDVAVAGEYEVQFKATFTNYALTYALGWFVKKVI